MNRFVAFFLISFTLHITLGAILLAQTGILSGKGSTEGTNPVIEIPELEEKSPSPLPEKKPSPKKQKKAKSKIKSKPLSPPEKIKTKPKATKNPPVPSLSAPPSLHKKNKAKKESAGPIETSTQPLAPPLKTKENSQPTPVESKEESVEQEPELRDELSGSELSSEQEPELRDELSGSELSSEQEPELRDEGEEILEEIKQPVQEKEGKEAEESPEEVDESPEETGENELLEEKPKNEPEGSSKARPLGNLKGKKGEGYNISPYTGEGARLRLPTQLRQREGNPLPIYPKEALKKKWEGLVEILYYVNPAGFVEKIQLKKSSGYTLLDNSALRALARYRYYPGQEGWVRHPVQFFLDREKEVLETAPLGENKN